MKSIFTGEIIGSLIFERSVKNNPIHRAIRGAIGDVFSQLLFPKFLPYNRDIATNFLEHSVTKEKLYHLKTRIKIGLPKLSLASAGKSCLTATKNLSINYLKHNKMAPFRALLCAREPTKLPERVNDLMNYLLLNYEQDDAMEIYSLVSNGKLSAAAHKVTILSLRPICEKAVAASINSALKTTAGVVYDFSIKKIITLTSLPIIYGLVLAGLEKTAQYYNGNAAALNLAYGAGIAGDTISPESLLWLMTASNAIDIGYLFLKTLHTKTLNNDLDKEEVKNLAFQISKESIAKKIQENSFIMWAGIIETPEEIEAVTKGLIAETVEFYWNDLSKIKFLGLPLVA